MIKRSAILLVMLLYLGTATGFAFNMHYCCGRLVSVKIDAPVKSCKMADNTEPGCCKNKHMDVKVKDAHQASVQLTDLKVFTFTLPSAALTGFSLFRERVTSITDANQTSPDPPSLNYLTFLKNRVFRI